MLLSLQDRLDFGGQTCLQAPTAASDTICTRHRKCLLALLGGFSLEAMWEHILVSGPNLGRVKTPAMEA